MSPLSVFWTPAQTYMTVLLPGPESIPSLFSYSPPLSLSLFSLMPSICPRDIVPLVHPYLTSSNPFYWLFLLNVETCLIFSYDMIVRHLLSTPHLSFSFITKMKCSNLLSIFVSYTLHFLVSYVGHPQKQTLMRIRWEEFTWEILPARGKGRK